MGYDSKHIKILTPQEGYNLIANEYKTYHDHLTSFDKGFFFTLLPRESKNLDIIDIGAGDGRIYKLLQDRNYQFKSFTACDISEKLLKQHPGNVEKIICNLEHPLPSSDSSFDLAFSFFVLEHIADLNHLFLEMERILRPARPGGGPGGKRIIGHFLQRREFIWKNGAQPFKIRLYNHRLQDIEKIAHKNLFNVTNYPIYEKGNLLGYIIVCEK